MPESRRLTSPRECPVSDVTASGRRRSCGAPEDGFFRLECAHGHVRDTYLCAGHAARPDGYCWICAQEDRCRESLHITRLEMGMDGWVPADA